MISELKKLLEGTNAHPFLFIGSGFTHRYLQTDDWKGLVSRFAAQALPENKFAYEWYKNEVSKPGLSEESILPLITQRVEKDYNSHFLSDAEYSDLRNSYESQVRNDISPLKIGVADWLLSQESGFTTPLHTEEISALGHSRKNIAGIITTNFDRFLEHLFPDHIPYVGQNQLLFNQSYGVGEIYKIHGCVSDPKSLVLTQPDYELYQSRNAYLSAKLLTIFLEHPIIFIGYSLNDSNIRDIFLNIANCLSEEQLRTLSHRLLFLQRSKADRPEGISAVQDHIEGKMIEFKRVVVSDFSIAYKAIAGLRTSYPPKLLRKLKKDVYELVLTTSPKERIRVVDIDNATDMDNVEHVMGVGISKRLAEQGIVGLEVIDLIEDLLFEDKNYDSEAIVDIVIPKLGRQFSYNLPIFKYLSQLTNPELKDGLRDYVEMVRRSGMQYWIPKSMKTAHEGKHTYQSLTALLQDVDSTNAKGTQQALSELAFIPQDHIILDELKDWLVKVYTRYDPFQNKTEPLLTTHFRRAVKIYDWLRYGKEKAPLAPKDEEAK